ncbi:lectin PVL [Coprinopsis sp. MPI-PUGE-AT-0042]|nr:lectin PVL [Coprinopsis sp. MPI-PUGE-AT-0042]
MSNPGPQILSDEQRARKVSPPPCIVGFGLDGVFVASPEVTWSGPMKIFKVFNNMAYDVGGWRPGVHPRLLADTTGDGHMDIVGFGSAGVCILRNSGNYTFKGPSPSGAEDFVYSSGWRHDRHIRLLSDLRGTGRADIVGFGNEGVVVSLNIGEGTYSPAKMILGTFGVAKGWAVDKHPRYLADTTGNGLPDIIGFGESHTYIARSKGDGTFHNAECTPNLDDFSYLHGWRVATHPRHMADLTGDGKADILGFKNDGVFASLNDGQGNFGPISFAVHDFGTCQGWQVDKHPRFVLPLTDRKAADIIGFGDAGVYVSMNKGDGTFERPKLVLGDFGFQQGWRTDRHLRQLVDLTGDGCPDIVGFGEEAIWVSFNTGQGTFGPAQKLNSEFTASKGWTCDKTVRFVSVL